MYRGFISLRYIDGSVPERMLFVNLVFARRSSQADAATLGAPHRYPRCP
jgi:hypothetical protein